MTRSQTDSHFMRLALREARKAIGLTSPNPAVGCVIVKSDKVVARGYHHAAGQPHAEIEALQKLTSAKNCSVYVTLEPCSSHGRTPPCTEALIQAGVREVIYGATDPNPAHQGRARNLLTQAGIHVREGVLAENCTKLNEEWNHWIRTGLPYVIAKCGMTLDGRIDSPPNSRWLTSEASRKDAMKRRARVDAILVGAETVRTDNPQLTVRGIRNSRIRQPKRIIWSRSGEIPADCHLLTDEWRESTLIFKQCSLLQMLRRLGKQGITSILIEGGGQTLGAALDQNLIQRVEIYVAPRITSGKIPAFSGIGVARNSQSICITSPRYQRIGSDLKISGNIITSI